MFKVTSQKFRCDWCRKEGEVPVEPHEDVFSVVYKIKDEHRRLSPTCEIPVSMIRLVSPSEVMSSSMTYYIVEDWGDCVKCGKYQDRRYGLCFSCAGTTTKSEYRKLLAEKAPSDKYARALLELELKGEEVLK